MLQPQIHSECSRRNGKTTRDRVRDRLEAAGRPLALHEFDLDGISQNNLGTRLPEYAKEGWCYGVQRNGTQYKEWGLTEWLRPKQGELDLREIAS